MVSRSRMDEEHPPTIPQPEFYLPEESPQSGNPVGWIIVGLVVLLLFVLNTAASITGDRLPRAVVDAERELELAVTTGRADAQQFAPTAKKRVQELLKTKGAARDHALRVAAVLQWEYGFGDPAATVRGLSRDAKDERERRLNRIWKAIYGERRFLPGDVAEAPELLRELGYPTVASLTEIHLLEKMGRDEEAAAQRRALVKSPWRLLPAGLLTIGLAGMAVFGLAIMLRYLAQEPTRERDYRGPWGFGAGDSMATAFLFYLFAGVVLSLPLAALPHDATGGGILVLSVEAVAAVAGLVASLWFLNRLARNVGFFIQDIGIRGRLDLRSLRIGVLGACASLGALAIGALVTLLLFPNSMQDTNPVAELAASGGIWGAILALVRGVVIAPVAEEVFFRGVLFMGLWRRLGSFWWAAVLSSLAFAAVHPTLLGGLLPLMGVGIVACVILRETGSLIPCAVMHAVYNGLLLVLAAVYGMA